MNERRACAAPVEHTVAPQPLCLAALHSPAARARGVVLGRLREPVPLAGQHHEEAGHACGKGSGCSSKKCGDCPSADPSGAARAADASTTACKAQQGRSDWDTKRNRNTSSRPSPPAAGGGGVRPLGQRLGGVAAAGAAPEKIMMKKMSATTMGCAASCFLRPCAAEEAGRAGPRGQRRRRQQLEAGRRPRLVIALSRCPATPGAGGQGRWT